MRVNIRDTFTECRYSNEVAITSNILSYKHPYLPAIIHFIIIQLSSITIENVIEIHSFIKDCLQHRDDTANIYLLFGYIQGVLNES